MHVIIVTPKMKKIVNGKTRLMLGCFLGGGVLMRVYVVSEAGLLNIFESVKEAKAFTLDKHGSDNYRDALSDGNYRLVIVGDRWARQYAGTYNNKQAQHLKEYFF